MDAVHTLKFEKKAIIPTDPRTKLFLTVTVSTIMITGGTGGFMNFVRPCLMSCPIIFLFLSKKWKAAARFAVTYAVLFILELTVLPLLTGTWNFVLGAAIGIYTHMLPGFIMGYYLVYNNGQRICRCYGTDACSAKNRHSCICRVPFFPYRKRGICSNS